MNQNSFRESLVLSDEMEDYVDGACDRFEDAWQCGQQPQIEDYLGDALGDLRKALLWELLRMELEYLRETGQLPTLEEQQQRFPNDSIVVERVFGTGLSTPGPGSVTLSFVTSKREAPEVPGYQIVRELGHGGMGVVYLAEQLSPSRRVALKMILDPEGMTESELARFQRECDALAKLGHPNVVQIYEVGTVGDLPFFSMELVSGSNLKERLNSLALKPSDAAELVRALALTMHHVHSHDIIHRDLKPQNVLLTENGAPKITDFGLAKQMGGTDELTPTEARMGPPPTWLQKWREVR